MTDINLRLGEIIAEKLKLKYYGSISLINEPTEFFFIDPKTKKSFTAETLEQAREKLKKVRNK